MRPLFAALAISLAVTACSNATNGGAPASGVLNPKAPVAFVLQSSDLRGYAEQSSSVVTAADLAQKDNDQTMPGALAREGFSNGANNEYADPGTTSPTVPFAVVVSQALFFTNATGAAGYFADEMERQRKRPAPPSGVTAPLPLPGHNDLDQADGITASAPADSTGDPAVLSYFGLLRKGRVVASISAYGDASVATGQAFATLVDAQARRLQPSPG